MLRNLGKVSTGKIKMQGLSQTVLRLPDETSSLQKSSKKGQDSFKI